MNYAVAVEPQALADAADAADALQPEAAEDDSAAAQEAQDLNTKNAYLEI